MAAPGSGIPQIMPPSSGAAPSVEIHIHQDNRQLHLHQHTTNIAGDTHHHTHVHPQVGGMGKALVALGVTVAALSHPDEKVVEQFEHIKAGIANGHASPQRLAEEVPKLAGDAVRDIPDNVRRSAAAAAKHAGHASSGYDLGKKGKAIPEESPVGTQIGHYAGGTARAVSQAFNEGKKETRTVDAINKMLKEKGLGVSVELPDGQTTPTPTPKGEKREVKQR